MPQIEISSKDIQTIKEFIPEFKKSMINVYPLIPMPYGLIAPVVVSLVSMAVLQVIDNLPPSTPEIGGQQNNIKKPCKDIVNKKSNPELYDKAG